MASNLHFERCGSNFIINVIYSDLLQYYRSNRYLVLQFTLEKIIPNQLQLCFMDIKDYLEVIYAVFYKYYHLFMVVIIQFYGIFLNIRNNMKKKVIRKHIINGTMHQMHDIMMEYQLQKTFMVLYIGYKMILHGLILTIIHILDIGKMLFLQDFYMKINMNEKIKYWFKNLKNHIKSRQDKQKK
eukprot:973158_1